MQTVHPVIVFGSYMLDLERLPPDEFQLRLRAVQAVLKEKGWAGVIASGNPESSALVTYVSNYSPRSRQALLLIPQDGAPRLLLWASLRDLKREAAMTWLEDTRMSGNVDETLTAWLADAKIASGTIGLFDSGNLRPPLHKSISGVLAKQGLSTTDADAEMYRLMHVKRPREMVMMRRAGEILAEAVKAMQDKWRSGATAGEALLAAEGSAFADAAQDVRTLLSLDGGRTLRPLYRAGAVRTDRLAVYMALRFQAYWAEAFVTLSDRKAGIDEAASDALAAIIAASRPGTTGRDLAAAAAPFTQKFQPHSVLAGSLGRGIGLALDEPPGLAAGSDLPMRAGGTYSLTVGLSDASSGGAYSLTSAMIALTESGRDILWQG